MRSFAFDTPRLTCVPLTDVDSGEFFKLVEESSVGQQRSSFKNPSDLLYKARHRGHVSIGAYLNATEDTPSEFIGCIFGVPMDHSLVLDFIIADKYRRKGLGTEFMRKFLKTCRTEDGIGRYQVQVEKSNLMTLAFLDSMNFSVYPGGDFSVTVNDCTHHFCTYRTRL